MKYLSIMMKITIIGVMVLFYSCKNNRYNYRIQEYNLTFEVNENTPDVKTTIEITYKIENNVPKSDGFKFIGNNVIDSLICSDETGILQSNIEYLKETKISWRFDAVRSGLKRIKATFLLKNFAERNENVYIIRAPWAGVFRVPIDRATYKILLPAGLNKFRLKEPNQWEHQNLDNMDSYYYQQAPLKEKSITVQFDR